MGKYSYLSNKANLSSLNDARIAEPDVWSLPLDHTLFTEDSGLKYFNMNGIVSVMGEIIPKKDLPAKQGITLQTMPCGFRPIIYLVPFYPFLEASYIPTTMRGYVAPTGEIEIFPLDVWTPTAHIWITAIYVAGE